MNEALRKKLRLSEESEALILNAPDASYVEALGLGEEALASEPEAYDFVLFFAQDVSALETYAASVIRAMKREGLLWIAYPKGTSKIKTDLNRDRGWESVHAAGWEGIALVSMNDTWSAMRFRPKDLVNSGTRGSRETDSNRSAANKQQTQQPLAVPEDLQQALDAAPEAAGFFTKLAPSHRKEYISWVIEAKREETRQKRIHAAVDKLSLQLKRPSDKA